jgi:UDP-N-acetylmuramate--alanine ligase
MKKPSSLQKPSVHFIGVGGIGMSSLAQWFLAQNWAVSGSDIARSVITTDLQKLGVNLKIGHNKANIPPKASLIIRSQAIRPQNPEFQAAKSRKLPVLTYPEAVGHLTRTHGTIAIAGAHGKSTTTALAALALVRAELDPTVLIGTRLNEFPQKNFRIGKGAWLVLEADEYGRAFLNYSPAIAVVTTIDAEHLDTYQNLAGVKRGFLQFIGNVRTGGTIILNRDDKNLLALRTKILHMARRKNQKVLWYSQKDRDAKIVQRTLAIPGAHNVSNALAVLRLAQALGIPERVACDVFKNYHGSWRRFEHKGAFRIPNLHIQADVYDDYAHHPTEIRATLQAFREKYPRSPIVCVYQPHQAERLRRLWKEFHTAFGETTVTLMLPMYKVAGRDADHPKYNSRELVREIQRANPIQRIFYLENPENLKRALTTLLTNMPRTRTPVVVMMGAGNIADYTAMLILNK